MTTGFRPGLTVLLLETQLSECYSSLSCGPSAYTLSFTCTHI